jgi:ABC-2 type transport system permease protein
VTVTAPGPPTRSAFGRDLKLSALQVGYEQRSYWRNPTAAFFTFALPLVFLFIFTSVFGNQDISYNHSGLVKVRGAQYYVPSILAYGVIAACFANLSITMCLRRDQGILKRVRGTPIAPWAYVAGGVGSSVVVAFLLTVITLGAGVVLYHVHWPHALGSLLVALVVGAASFCALGLALTAAIPNADAAPPVVNIVMLVLLFIAGTYFPVNPSSTLGHIASVFPVLHFTKSVFAPIVPQPGQPSWAWHHILVVGAWGVGGLLVAVRRFRWEPRTS